MAYRYVEKSSKRAKKTPGKSYVTKGKRPRLGTGKRFSALEKNLEERGAKDPSGLAAYIGRRKVGAKKMAKMATKARRRK